MSAPSPEACELCGVAPATWFYPSRDVSQQIPAIRGLILSVGSWIVCTACKQLAGDRDWRALLERQVEGIRRRLVDPGGFGPDPAVSPGEERRLREVAATVQTLLRTAMTGPARPRTAAPAPPSIGGDLDAYREGWTEVWRQAPGNQIGRAHV